MRINVGTKLWLAFMGTIALCVLTLYLLLHNSLRQGFLDYTSQQSVQRLMRWQIFLIAHPRFYMPVFRAIWIKVVPT